MTDSADRNSGWVLYDGDCPMCVDLAKKFERTLQGRGFLLAPLQSSWAQARLGLPPNEPLTEMKVLTRNGSSIGGADAVVYLAREIWWAWPLAVVARLPLGMPVLRRAYRWIAARRHCANRVCLRPRSVTWPGWLPLIVLPSGVVAIRSTLPPWAFMWALAVAIYSGCKWLTWWRNKHIPTTRIRHLGYLLAWPGMDAKSFLEPTIRPPRPSARDWIWAALKMAVGVVLFWGVVRRIPSSLALLRGWVGLVGLIFVLHFGSFHLVALLWQRGGVAAAPIMRAPVLATSLSEFWGRRWNLGFHELAGSLIFEPLRNRIGATAATFAAFLASGLIHDLVISFPSGGGYGLPTAYFTVQAVGLLFERSQSGKALSLGRGISGWMFTLLVAAGPAFWLFHPWFVMRVVIPFLEVVRAL